MREHTEPWSNNLHYQSVILSSVPAGCERALDVGCGLGALTRRLRSLVPHVTGIDKDQRSIECARAHPDAGDIVYLHDDFLTSQLSPESVDLITAVASLHHMDAVAALERMRDLLRPGGVLVVVGLAKGGSPADLVLIVPALIGTRLHRLAAHRHATPPGTYSSPICWPPPVSYSDMRRLAQRLLPGARYRRHLYWRYSLTWSKPLNEMPPQL
jgi:SAM-dependent methyltransferase